MGGGGVGGNTDGPQMTIMIKFGNRCVSKFVLTLTETYCIKTKSIKIVALEHKGIEVDAEKYTIKLCSRGTHCHLPPITPTNKMPLGKMR